MKNNYGITTQGFRRLSQISGPKRQKIVIEEDTNLLQEIADYANEGLNYTVMIAEDGEMDVRRAGAGSGEGYVLEYDVLSMHENMDPSVEWDVEAVKDHLTYYAESDGYTLVWAGEIDGGKPYESSGIQGNKKTGFKYDYKRVWKVNLGEPWLSDANKKYIEEQEYESFDEALEDAQEYLGWDEVIEIDVGDGYFLYPSEEDAEEGAEDYSFDGPSIREIEKEVYPENMENGNPALLKLKGKNKSGSKRRAFYYVDNGLIREEAIDEAGIEAVEELEGLNVDFTNNARNDDLVEFSASTKFVDAEGDKRHLTMVYLKDKEEVESVDELDQLDWDEPDYYYID